jgi:hypothetical protein
MNEFDSVVISVVPLCRQLPPKTDLEPLAALLVDNFPYYELVFILHPGDETERFGKEILAMPNTRCIILNDFAPESVVREKAFAYAIGDQVVLWNMEEADPDVIPHLVRSNLEGNDLTCLLFKKTDSSLYGRCSQLFTAVLNKITGYSVNNKISNVACYSRTLVNSINSRDMGLGYLKIVLASIGFKQKYIEGAARIPKRSFAQLCRRITDSLEIIGSVPHRLLKATALGAFFGFLGCFFYMLYVCCVWILLPGIQPGWTTTSLVSSALFSVVFFAVFVFSCIFLNRLSADARDKFCIARESSSNEFIRSFDQLNITDSHE